MRRQSPWFSAKRNPDGPGWLIYCIATGTYYGKSGAPLPDKQSATHFVDQLNKEIREMSDGLAKLWK